MSLNANNGKEQSHVETDIFQQKAAIVITVTGVLVGLAGFRKDEKDYVSTYVGQ